ncbi:MAG TPA: replication initiation factor domain-containing protein, partial [Nitrospira sp.]|nr:replication initiation factor domain-containing protein [Nitrospira sp.]
GKLGTGAPRSPSEVHVDLSAGIVSAWPTSRVRTVLQWIFQHEGHLTRLDCALDDRTCTVPLETIKTAIETGQCVTRADRVQTIACSSIRTGTPSGETLYVGSSHSQTLLRIYDKRAELQAKGRNDGESHGIRWELQLKQDRAQVCGQVLAYLEETDWLEFIIGVLRSYVEFRHTTREDADEDRYRAPVLGWWQELTDGFRKGRLVIEKDKQSLPKVKRWVKHSVAPMLAVICAQHPDGKAWLEKQIVAAVGRWKPKHRALLKPASTEKAELSTGGHAGAPSQGGEGVSSDSPCE